MPTISAPALAGKNSELLFFPSLSGVHRSDLDPASRLEANDTTPLLGIFFTINRERFRFLGEIAWSDEEVEIERLQFGWKLKDNGLIWLGRHHVPLGYWNTQFHHGAFLQTSISRPGIVMYEDEGGILPAHMTGVLFENLYQKDGHGWRSMASLAVGPQLKTKLDPHNVLHLGKGEHKLGATIRVSYLPKTYETNEVGGFAHYSRIPGSGGALNEAKLSVYGVFGNWQWKNTRVLGAIFHIEHDLELTSGADGGAFNSAYLQLEYSGRSNWTYYGRGETTSGEDNDAYLALLPDFVKARSLAGVRYDITRKQSIKFEFSRNQLQNEAYSQFSIQWSAVLP